jgi:peptidyl-prolyl cis-trans isomerase SurA
MKRLAIKVLISLLFIPISIFAKEKSDDPIIVTIDNQKITKSEFLRVYSKNNNQGNTDIKSYKEYMDMFVNYKLKVIEAEHEGYDTVASFRNEFKGYRNQLAKPYLIDNNVNEQLLKEAYSRLMQDVHARTIIIKIHGYGMPADTLNAYNRAIEARNLLLKGEPWDSVALKFSADPNVKKYWGDVKYFTVFQMKYPFESAAYNLKINEYSMPFQIQNAYYIVQTLDKRPSRGIINAEHIMVAFPENATPNSIDSAHKKIMEIYAKLKAGEKFEDLAEKYSDDRRSAKKGGDLGWFSNGQMVPEFEDAAFALQHNGDYSEPIRTAFGWHIIKRLDHKFYPPFDSVQNNIKESIKQKVQNDDRSKLAEYAVINRVKKEIGFKDNPSTIYLLQPFLDSTVFIDKWNPEKAKSVFNEKLFKLEKNEITLKDFADYIAVSHKFRKPIPFDYFLYNQYQDFVIDKVREFQDSRLADLYPEFKYLVQEYHDGILLFNLMDKKVWSEAAKDTVGLEKYYNDHKDTYKWGERVNALVITSTDKDKIDQAYKFANDYLKGTIKSKDILIKVCNGDTIKPCINITETAFEKGDNTLLDSIGWNTGVSSIISNAGKYGFFVKKDKLAPEQKQFKDVKGTCIADYQGYLEQKFLDELHKKYKVEINEKVLNSLKN